MTDITIIGSGNMARAIGTRAVAAGRSLQILSRSPEHAAKLAAGLGADTTSGGLGDIPEGDIVVLALYFGPAKEVATHYGDTLSGKTVVEISNPADPDTFDSLTVEPGSSAAEEIAALLPGAASGQGLQHHVRRPADGRSHGRDAVGCLHRLRLRRRSQHGRVVRCSRRSPAAAGGRAEACPGTGGIPAPCDGPAGQPRVRGFQLGHRAEDHRLGRRRCARRVGRIGPRRGAAPRVRPCRSRRRSSGCS